MLYWFLWIIWHTFNTSNKGSWRGEGLFPIFPLTKLGTLGTECQKVFLNESRRRSQAILQALLSIAFTISHLFHASWICLTIKFVASPSYIRAVWRSSFKTHCDCFTIQLVPRLWGLCVHYAIFLCHRTSWTVFHPFHSEKNKANLRDLIAATGLVILHKR